MAFKIFRKNCCGLDVHKTWIYACIGITDTNGRTEYHQSRFSSFTNGLRDLAKWLDKYACKEVCMESTGKYWIPVFNILEQSCMVTLAHPKYTKLTLNTQSRKRVTRPTGRMLSGYAIYLCAIWSSRALFRRRISVSFATLCGFA